MNSPLVSVVMPVHNVRKYIGKAIDSVLNQTYENFELIIVDDGSPDDSGKIADMYAEANSKIKVIHKENGGLSDARNAGMEIASGKYICFFDSDDYIDDNLLETCVKLAEKDNADVIIFGFYLDKLDNNENVISTETTNCRFSKFNKINLKDINLNQSMLALLCYAWNKIYRLDFLINNKFQFTKGLSLVEDIVFNSPVLSEISNIVFSDKPLYHYISRPRETLVNKFYLDSYRLHLMKMKSMMNLLDNWGIDTLSYKGIMAETHIMGIRFCCSNMFYNKTTLNVFEKYKYIRTMLNDKFTKDILNTNYKIHTDIVNTLIKNRNSLILTILYLENSFVRKVVSGK